MTKKRILKISLVSAGAIIILGASLAFYLFNMPHRDVQGTKTDFAINASTIVSEYLSNAETANEKYLDSDGDSKIIEVTGIISNISEDYNNNKVVLLKSSSDKAGVSCTFSKDTNINASNLKIGEEATIKGVIRAGASFDGDLDMYEHVIMEKCDVV